MIVSSSLIGTADPTRVPAMSGRVHGGYHVLKIHGHSRTLHAAPRRCFESCPFRAGEHHTWLIRYFPKGHVPENSDYIAVYLVLVDTAAGEEGVLAQFTFSLLDQDQKPVPSYVATGAYNFSEPGSNIGFPKFMERGKLERSGLVKDDCFAVRVDVHLVGMSCRASSAGTLHQHFGDLLASKRGADVEFHVRGETFAAHRLVLRARSPVFKALLLIGGGARANTSSNAVVEIDDMEPRVFEVLLTFIYTDAWPNMEQDDGEASAMTMARGLLAAADKYDLQGLKLMCENWLCNRIDRASVSTLLALSEKHHCANLKDACFDFVSSLTLLSAINDETGGFDDLAQSYPHIANELIVNAIHCDREKEKNNAASLWNMGTDQDGVIKTSKVARANNSTTASSLFYLFSGFVISVIINSYVGV